MHVGGNMFRFQEIGIEILKTGIPYKANEYGNIIAAKPNSLETYNLLKEYHAAAKSSCYSSLSISDIDGEFEGEDWYFFEGEPGDQYGPSTYRLESLTHKKKVFAAFCEQFVKAG